MTIKVGDWIRVPKGTHLIKDYGKGHYGEGKAPTSREVVVQVSNVTDIDPYYFRDLLSLEDFSEFKASENNGRNTYGSGHTDETRASAQKIYDAALTKARSKIKGGASKLVHWSNDKKAVLDVAIEKVEAPAPRKKAEPKINKRQQMVNKSRWKFTLDVDIYYGAANPVFNKHIAAWDKANPQPTRPVYIGHNATDAEYAAWKAKEDAFTVAWQKHVQDRETMRAAAEKSIGEYTPVLYRSIKAGEVFTVRGKFNSWFAPHGVYGQQYTNTAEVQFDGEDKIVGLEYSIIKDYIEAESVPTVDVWVLRHKTTGTYYKSPDYSKGNYRWKNHYEKSINEDNGVDYQVMVDTFMKGKKWDNLGRAKTSILTITGYYENLPGADDSLPEWGGGGKTFHMTDDWELVKFDKLARQEIGPVADFHEWFKNSWRLRALTVQFGSSVRTAYKALEKANLLDSQKGMVVFTETDEEKLYNTGYYGDKTAISDEEKALIDAAIASTKMSKGTFKKAVDTKSVAVTFPNKGAAMMFKLAYTGNLKTTIIDLETLKEAVDD